MALEPDVIVELARESVERPEPASRNSTRVLLVMLALVSVFALVGWLR